MSPLSSRIDLLLLYRYFSNNKRVCCESTNNKTVIPRVRLKIVVEAAPSLPIHGGRNPLCCEANPLSLATKEFVVHRMATRQALTVNPISPRNLGLKAGAVKPRKRGTPKQFSKHPPSDPSKMPAKKNQTPEIRQNPHTITGIPHSPFPCLISS